MNKKLWFLTKKSLDKKIKTKWFVVANVIFFILIAAVFNIDRIIKLFGGDFSENVNIMVIDNANVFEDFKNNYLVANSYISSYDNTEITIYNKAYDEAIEEIQEDKHKILLVIDNDADNIISAKLVSKKALGTITSTILNTSLTAVRSELALKQYNISKEEFANINVPVAVTKEVLDEDNKEDGIIVSSVMQVITLPIFI